MAAETPSNRKQKWTKPELRRISPTPEIIAAFAQIITESGRRADKPRDGEPSRRAA